MTAPKMPPTVIAITAKVIVNASELKKSTDTNVAATAINIPIIPSTFPLLDDSGEDKPLRAVINRIPDITYATATKLCILIFFICFRFFLIHCEHSLCD